ncbi:MAG: LiaF domain-containing protein [Candidatus Kapaibacterium sp.]
MSVKNVIGVLFILFGIGYLLNAFDVLDFSIGQFFHNWYPILIILFGVHLISNKKFVFGTTVSLFGILLQLEQLRIIDISVWQLVFPFALVGIGVNMIIKKNKHSSRTLNDYNVDKNFEINNVFSSDERNVNSASLERGEVISLFGSATVDMSNSIISDNNFKLEMTSIFGSIDIRLPEDCRIELKGTPIFGSIDDRTRANPISTKKVILDCTCVFGGIDIRN